MSDLIGTYNTRLNLTIPTESETLPGLGQPRFSDLPSRPWRGTLITSCSRGGWDVGCTVSYTPSYWLNTSISGVTQNYVGKTLIVDGRLSYTVPALGKSGWKRFVSHSRINVQIYNIADVEPYISDTGAVRGNVDPRGRQVEISYKVQL